MGDFRWVVKSVAVCFDTVKRFNMFESYMSRVHDHPIRPASERDWDLAGYRLSEVTRRRIANLVGKG